ncbi:hypothetical protein RFI_33395, partial [Reticulomyxa filosa]
FFCESFSITICQHVILRQWHKLEPGLEFRAFVFKGEMTALCQYNYIGLFEELWTMDPSENEGNKGKAKKVPNHTICDHIFGFWKNNLKDLLAKKYDHYVIDFSMKMSATTDTPEIVVIELNPFEPDTDALMFDWKKDRHQLMYGKLEFRVQKYKFTPNELWRLLPKHKLLVQQALERFSVPSQ